MIRHAIKDDAAAIQQLLEQLGYPITLDLLQKRLDQLLQDPDEEILVVEIDASVRAFISIHYIPQIALSGDFARISYFCIDRDFRSQGIGKTLEAYSVELAQKRGCDRIEVHCHARRTEAHRFYQRQGYHESPKYLMKLLRNEH